MLAASCKPKQTIDFVTDVAKAAGLASIAVNRDVLAKQRLPHEIGDYASVIQLDARAIGIEDSRDTRIQLLITVVCHGGGFGEALGFVIHRARTDGIHIAPIAFLLRMLQRIAVAL